MVGENGFFLLSLGLSPASDSAFHMISHQQQEHNSADPLPFISADLWGKGGEKGGPSLFMSLGHFG